MNSIAPMARSQSPDFPFLPAATRVAGPSNEWAELFGYQPTSIPGVRFFFLRNSPEDQACNPWTIASSWVIEAYVGWTYRASSGTTTSWLTLTEIQPPKFTPWPVMAGGWLTAPALRAESTADLLIRIRAHLSLNTSELARTLDVERPTIYAWMRNAHIPQPEHLDRLMTLGRLARFWTERCNEPVGKARYATVENLTLLDILSARQLDEKGGRRVLAALAQKAKATPLSEVARSAQAIHQRARERGWQLTNEETREQVVRSISSRNKR